MRHLKGSPQTALHALGYLFIGELVILWLSGHGENNTMKRPMTGTTPHYALGYPKIDLKPELLSGIGAVAVAWNIVEDIIHDIFNASTGLHHSLWLEIPSRINGFDGIVELIRISAQTRLQMPPELFELLDNSLAGAKEYKGYRDAIIHAQVYEATLGIGITYQRRGKVIEVLLSQEALDGLYDRLVLLRDELMRMLQLAFSISLYLLEKPHNERPDLPKLLSGQGAQTQIARCREHQTARRSLPPLPKFPDAPSVPQGLASVLPGDP